MHIKLSLPEGTSGDWKLESYQENGINYQKLTRNGINMMMNTPEIVEGFVDFLTRAEGVILINGLGIGMCCEYLLNKPSVTGLTVIEYELDVINLVAPYYEKDTRCTFIHADAFTYEPPFGKQYDYVWHDVWTLYSSKNLKDMDVLFEKYKDIAGWQDAWAREKCLKMQEKEQRIRASYQ